MGTRALVVPDYQRPYSWTTREAQQLLDDLLLASADRDPRELEAGDYFLGSVLLMDSSGGTRHFANSDIEHDIIDGQQRIVTLTILLAVLRDLVADAGGSLAEIVRPVLWDDATGIPVPRVHMRGKEQDLFRIHVQQDGASMVMPENDDLPPGQARIVEVRETFVENLVEMNIEELTRLSVYILRSCHIALITTNSIDHAHRIFSVLNGRGRPLARNDILKARILGGIPPDRRAQFVPAWEQIEQRLGTDFEGLFSHIRTIEGQGRERVISGIGSLINASGGAEPFFSDVLLPYAEIYAKIRNLRSNEGQPLETAARHLSYLQWLGSDDWLPAMMRFWRQCDGRPDEIAEFAERLERLAFCLRLLGLGAEKRQTRFAAVLKNVRQGKWRDTTDNPLEMTREEIRNIQYNLRNLHGRSQLTCKLVLMRLNDEIAGLPQGLEPNEYTVEHVLPQKPGRNSHWRTWFPSPEEREKCTQSLGNLILVTRTQNDRAKNLDLPRKQEIYFADGPEKVPPISQDLYGASKWCADHILEREHRLLVSIQSVWKIETVRSDDQSRGSPQKAPKRSMSHPEVAVSDKRN